MNNSNFLKVIMVVIFSLFLFSCSEKPSFSLLSIELVRQDSFDMDIVINLKDGYLLHKGRFMVHAGETSLSPDIFELTKEQTDSLSVLYKAIKVTEEKRKDIDKKMLLSYIEAVEGNKIIAQRRQNSKRTQEEKIFLKKILNLIATKSKASNARREMEILIKAL